MKRPAALRKAAKAAKPAALEKAAKAKPAALETAAKRNKKRQHGSSGTRKVWEKVYMTTGQNPPRSYQASTLVKKHRIVEVSAARCPQSQEIILEIKAAWNGFFEKETIGMVFLEKKPSCSRHVSPAFQKGNAGMTPPRFEQKKRTILYMYNPFCKIQ